MSEKPILFSGSMVRAILAGRKTQTRRVVKAPAFLDNLGAIEHFHHATEDWWSLSVKCPNEAKGKPCPDDPVIPHGHLGSVRCPYGQPGDRLWVRETWGLAKFYEDGDVRDWKGPVPKEKTSAYGPVFAADPNWDPHFDDRGFKWRPSIHMPRWASRITLPVESVRVERLQDISEEDAKAEGVESDVDRYVTAFAYLWDSINGKKVPWSSNPWVWVVTFGKAEVRQ